MRNNHGIPWCHIIPTKDQSHPEKPELAMLASKFLSCQSEPNICRLCTSPDYYRRFYGRCLAPMLSPAGPATKTRRSSSWPLLPPLCRSVPEPGKQEYHDDAGESCCCFLPRPPTSQTDSHRPQTEHMSYKLTSITTILALAAEVTPTETNIHVSFCSSSLHEG